MSEPLVQQCEAARSLEDLRAVLSSYALAITVNGIS